MVEVAPVCSDDLVYLPPKVRNNNGGLAEVMLCHKVSSCIHLIDPVSLRSWDVTGQEYFRMAVAKKVFWYDIYSSSFHCSEMKDSQIFSIVET